MRLLVDTNVLVDLVAAREPFVSDIRTLCIASTFGDVQLWASTQSFADAYYVLRRSASEEAVKRALLASLEFFVPCGTHGEDLRPALESDWHDLGDYLIAHSSRHVDAAFFVTRDAEVARKCPIPALSPREMVRHLEEECGLAYDDIEL